MTGMNPKDLQEVLEEAAPYIDANVALTGRPREEYEAYLTREPADGVSWSTAIHARMESLKAGPPPSWVTRELSRMVTPRPASKSDAA